MALVHSDPFLKYLPSEVAVASVCLARHTLDQQPAWVCTVIQHLTTHLPYLFLSLCVYCSLCLSRPQLATLSVMSATVCRICTGCLQWHRSSHSKLSDSSTALRSESPLILYAVSSFEAVSCVARFSRVALLAVPETLPM